MKKLTLGLGGIAALAITTAALAASAGADSTADAPPVLRDRADPLPRGAPDGHPDRRAGDRGALRPRRRRICRPRTSSPATRRRAAARRPSRSSTRTTTRRSSRISTSTARTTGSAPCTTANGCFKKVNQDGEQGNYPPIANPDWEPEIALDVEMVSAICPKCHILLVEANSADEAIATSNPVQHCDLGAAVDTAVNLGATEVSNSYGTRRAGAGPDVLRPLLQPSRRRDHRVAPATRTTATSWPAASPYVTAVGGTELVKDPSTARGWSESVWGSAFPGVLPNDAQGTGSGCSTWEPKPAWQHDAGCANRTVADVSAVADNVAIYDSSPEIGGWGVVAGTSISSPVIASVYALAGNAKSVNYGSYPYSHTSGLFDVVTGSNFTPTTLCGYLCQAGPGYDGPTGLGTPNGISGF